MTLALLIEFNPVVMMLIKYFNITLTILLLILYLLPNKRREIIIISIRVATHMQVQTTKLRFELLVVIWSNDVVPLYDRPRENEYL